MLAIGLLLRLAAYDLRFKLGDLFFYHAALPRKGGEAALELMNLTVPDADDGRILNVGCFDILG